MNPLLQHRHTFHSQSASNPSNTIKRSNSDTQTPNSTPTSSNPNQNDLKSLTSLSNNATSSTVTAKPIRQQVWQSQLPVRFVLSQDEVRDFGAVAEHYALVPRIGYLPQYVMEALGALKNQLNRPENAEDWEWWVEFEGSFVKW